MVIQRYWSADPDPYQNVTEPDLVSDLVLDPERFPDPDPTSSKTFGSDWIRILNNIADAIVLSAFLTAGEWCSYSQADMPAHVKAKLGQIPLILEQLMAAGHQPKRNIHA